MSNVFTPEEKAILCELAKLKSINYREVRKLYPSLFENHSVDSIKNFVYRQRSDLYKKDYMQERHNLLVNKGTKEYKALIKINALQDRIIETIEERLPNLNIRIPKYTKPKGHKSTESFVVNLADLHIGEVINKQEMMGLNEYNLSIMEKRFNFYIDTIINIKENKLNYNFDELVIFFLGDMFSGDIHEELSNTNEANIIDCLFSAANMMFSAIVYLLNFFSIIRLEGVVGNHSRLKKKVYYKQRYANWDFVLYKTLEMLINKAGLSKRIICNFPKSIFLLTKIKKSNFLALHGGDIKSYNSIPWYGIQRASAQLMDILTSNRKFFDYIILAHFHSNSTIDRAKGEKILCGSMIGANEFSLIRSFTGSRPRQLIFGVHKDEGVTWRYPINLDLKSKSKVNIRFKFDYE